MRSDSSHEDRRGATRSRRPIPARSPDSPRAHRDGDAALATLAREFAHSPEQIGLYYLDLAEQGEFDGAQIAAIHRKLSMLSGTAFADRALGGSTAPTQAGGTPDGVTTTTSALSTVPGRRSLLAPPPDTRRPSTADDGPGHAAGPRIALPRGGGVHPVAAAMAQTGVRFRMPGFSHVKAALEDKDLKIPEAVVKDRVERLLTRMKLESRVQSKDSVAAIMAKIFPGPGKIDEAEFNKALDTKDRKVIYEDVADALTQVKKPDQAKLKAAIKDAISLVQKAEADAAGLTAVFGTKSATAKANYAKARAALGKISGNMAKHISTDYNLDDPEVGLGGWAMHSEQKMHLTLEIVKVTDPKETQTTLIHEACHLADSAVDDLGYYGTTGFEARSEDQKVCNAAHYEELPRRELGTSSYVGATFTPGVNKTGKVLTREDKVRDAASEHLREAWDAAVDTHSFFRGVRKAYLNGSKAPFKTNKAFILEASRLMDLTIHEQAPAEAIVTTLDVTLTESMARTTAIVGAKVGKVPFPNPVGTLTDDELRDQLVATAVSNYGQMLKDAKRDKALLDWFVAHYRGVPSV